MKIDHFSACFCWVKNAGHCVGGWLNQAFFLLLHELYTIRDVITFTRKIAFEKEVKNRRKRPKGENRPKSKTVFENGGLESHDRAETSYVPTVCQIQRVTKRDKKLKIEWNQQTK